MKFLKELETSKVNDTSNTPAFFLKRTEEKIVEFNIQ